MNYLEDICLTSIVVSSILTGRYPDPYHFTWDRVLKHGNNFGSEYKYKDAQALLQLSLMVTSTNYEKKPLNVPKAFKHVALTYEECPIIHRDEHVHHNEGQEQFGVEEEGILGYILKKANTVIIIFSGTSNVCQAWIDMNYRQQELTELTNYHESLKGHNGIYMAYLSIRDQLMETLKSFKVTNKTQIIITGHSLGGGLSQLCALDLAYYDPVHYSFAAPMVYNTIGCQVFDTFVKKSYRIANISDLVVLSPLPIMPSGDFFCHVGEHHIFQNNMGSYPLNHSMAYVNEYELLEK